MVTCGLPRGIHSLENDYIYTRLPKGMTESKIITLGPVLTLFK